MRQLENMYLGEKVAQQTDGIERLPDNIVKPRKKEVELSDHIQFQITEKSEPKANSIDEPDQVDDGDFEAGGNN